VHEFIVDTDARRFDAGGLLRDAQLCQRTDE
jgi:hypothetical protein